MHIAITVKEREKMTAATTTILPVSTLETILTDTLNFLVEHNIKGAKLIQSGLSKAEDFVAHNAILKEILKLLTPVFALGDSAIVAYLTAAEPALLPIYTWAKEAFVAMVGPLPS